MTRLEGADVHIERDGKVINRAFLIIHVTIFSLGLRLGC